MIQKSGDNISQYAAIYDFSLECPKFREQMFTEFSKRANGEWSMPLTDNELSLPSAAVDSPTESSENAKLLRNS